MRSSLRKFSLFSSVALGTVALAASAIAGGAQIVDDGDFSFATDEETPGTWVAVTGVGYQDDYRYAPPELTETGSAIAVWNFADQVPGTYRVSATWSGSLVLNASNANFTVWRGTTALFARQIDQRVRPDSFTELGTHWEDLTDNDHQVVLTGTSSITVVLDNTADGRVVADAIRVERQ